MDELVMNIGGFIGVMGGVMIVVFGIEGPFNTLMKLFMVSAGIICGILGSYLIWMTGDSKLNKHGGKNGLRRIHKTSR